MTREPGGEPIAKLGWIFLKLGVTAFGGMGASLALLERELVEDRALFSGEDIAEALAVAKLLPGSSLTQVVSFLGYRLGGWRGALVATLMYLLPSAVAMFLLAVFYDRLASIRSLAAAGHGVAAAVVGLLAGSLIRMGRGAIDGGVSLAIVLLAFGAAAVAGLPAALIVAVAGLCGIALLSVPSNQRSPRTQEGGRS